MNDALRPEALIGSRSLAREQDLVEEFLNRYRDSSFRIAMRIVGNADAAEDVAQEALIRAFKSWDRLAGVESQAAWVRKIVVRCALNALERTPCHEPVPESAAHQSAEESVLVQQVLAGLPSEQRVLLGLAVGEGWSYKEIASILEIPMGTVASRVHAAKAAFRKAWEDAK
jgi:RNA polymerase sigma-70 factor (ECF subfamily)